LNIAGTSPYNLASPILLAAIKTWKLLPVVSVQIQLMEVPFASLLLISMPLFLVRFRYSEPVLPSAGVARSAVKSKEAQANPKPAIAQNLINVRRLCRLFL
jgi:hypothetical protein